jgi:RNA-directed DNA polymerase
MRAAQFKILTRILEKVKVPEYVYAFEKGRNIPKMAEAHAGKGLVISMDLKDFFTSIKQRHLLKIFQDLGFGGAPAQTLSELCTFKSFVPQGALTSPKISNIVTAFTFGPELKAYCDQKGYTLTVYADDITISCEEDLVKNSGYDAAFEIVGFVSKLVGKYGFRVNRDKTKVMRPFQRQYVCGVVVNRKINLQKTERNRLRAIVHNTVTKGVEEAAKKANLTPAQFVSRTMGQLNWFGQLNPEAGVRLKSLFKEAVQELGTPNAISDGEENTAPPVTPEVTIA